MPRMNERLHMERQLTHSLQSLVKLAMRLDAIYDSSLKAIADHNDNCPAAKVALILATRLADDVRAWPSTPIRGCPSCEETCYGNSTASDGQKSEPPNYPHKLTKPPSLGSAAEPPRAAPTARPRHVGCSSLLPLRVSRGSRRAASGRAAW